MQELSHPMLDCQRRCVCQTTAYTQRGLLHSSRPSRAPPPSLKNLTTALWTLLISELLAHVFMVFQLDYSLKLNRYVR